MFIRELAISALKESGIAHGDNVPADRFDLAVKAVGTALRFYSDCDTIDCFSEHKSVTLGNETTIGIPSLKRGVRLHNIASIHDLPPLNNYSPNDGSYIIGRDYWYAEDAGNFYKIEPYSDYYMYSECLQDEFADKKVDIYIKDFGKVVALYNQFGRLSSTTLSKFFGYEGGVFVSNIDGDGRAKVYVKETGDYEMVYSRRMVFNENTQIDLPASQEMLIVKHVAFALARSSEKKSQLKVELDAALEAAQDTALDYTIPTRSEW